MTTAVTRRAATDQAVRARRTVEDLLGRVRHRLASFLAAERAHCAEVHEHAVVAVDALADLAAGGPLLRPAFCLTGYLAAGGDPEEAGIVDAAAALELLHLSTLVHGDVLDGSRTRRGKPAVHVLHSTLHRTRGWHGESRRFGEGVAVVAGDLALVYSDELMAGAPRGARTEWRRLRPEAVLGPYLDLAAAAEFSAAPDLPRLTALLTSGRRAVRRPLVLGASAAGRPDLAGALAPYGEAVGEASRLRDDLLDAFGDPAHTGATAGPDFPRHKVTLLLGRAMQRDSRLRDLITEPGHTPDEIRARLLETGVTADAEQRIAHLVDQGCAALADAPLPPQWRARLTDMALRAAYRDK